LLADLAELATLAEAADALEEAEAAEAPALTCCFAAGTPVHTKRGIVAVEKVKVGDLVLSRNRSTGKLEYKKVTALTKPHQDKLLEMRIEGETKPLHPTADHPFWVKRGDAEDGDWILAAKMQVGDLVLSIEGMWRKVISITPLSGQQTVFNFEVDDNHDYFVGTPGVLVHNNLCLFKMNVDTGVPVQEGDYNLFLPSQGSAAAAWAQNEANLLDVMSEGQPISDTYIDSETGDQIATDPQSFLGMERSLLESNNWVYNSSTRAYMPPVPH
jgi:hypothetical protein